MNFLITSIPTQCLVLGMVIFTLYTLQLCISVSCFRDSLFRLYTAKNRNGAAGQLFGYSIIYERMQIEEIGELDDESE